MRRIRLTLEYDGSDFYGWQLQAGGERTVQGVLERALADIPGAKPRIIAAGRTDAGVHALAMTAHYDTADTIPLERVQAALNARLPADVRVLSAELASPDFHAQFSCCYRRYLYRLRLVRGDERGVALARRRALHLWQRLELAAMSDAARYFEGTHDFAALATDETRATVRTVYRCRLQASGRELALHVVADGFLRNMVRALVGTLLWVGEGRLRPEAIPALLATKDRRQAGHNVPPHGLYFVEAGYTPWDPSSPDPEPRHLFAGVL
jgi:tRNA pseudouridine38-40 synthase